MEEIRRESNENKIGRRKKKMMEERTVEREST